VSLIDSDSHEANAVAVEIAQSGIDVDRLVTEAIRQDLLALLWMFLFDNGLDRLLPGRLRSHTMNAARLTRYKAEKLVQEAAAIVNVLERTGLRVACTKGVIFQSLLYDSKGTRPMSDVDLMILPEQRAEVADALQGLGLTPATRYDPTNHALVEIPRASKLVYRMYPDHLPHFGKLSDDALVPFVRVDVAFSLTWFGSGWQIPMEEVLATVDRVPAAGGDPSVTLTSMPARFSFLFLVLHLFREGWFLRSAAAHPVRLIQFADILRLWRRTSPQDRLAITEEIARHQLGPAIAWVCHHVDSIYGTSLGAELGVEVFADPVWLRSAAEVDGYVAWHGDMRARLARTRPVEFTPAPEPPHGAAARGSLVRSSR
jgi:hypothetical protein